MSRCAGVTNLIAIAACGGAAVLGSAANGAAAPGKLMGMLPKGFSSTNCQEKENSAGSVERVMCSHSTDASGPTYAVFLLYASAADAETQFKQAADNGYTIGSTCPSGGPSPTTWTRQDTGKVSGQIECGTSVENEPAIIWTDSAKPWLAVIHGKDAASLYQWWHTTP